MVGSISCAEDSYAKFSPADSCRVGTELHSNRLWRSSLREHRFLTLFFVVLALAVAVAAWLRIESVNQTVVPAAEAPEDPAEVRTPVRPDPAVVAAGRDAATESTRGTAPYGANSDPAQTRSERERRYRELLATPPPPAPTTPAPAETSLLGRVSASIANALGAAKKPAAPPPVAPAPPSPATRAAQRAAAVVNEAKEKEGEATSTAEEQDPETDITPPQLQSVEFSPAEIRDDETTTLIASIVDNLSGVRSASGVIASPSGSVHGFSAVREGDGNRFVARVKVPRDAPEGMWTVKYMTLIDNATNSAHLNQAQGALPATAQFRVISSGADAKGPQLSSIWLDRPAMRSGERNKVFVRAEDDKAGVSLVSGMFVSPARHARLGFGCVQGAGGTWECSLTAPACLDCGTWRLEQVQLQDKAGNLATFRADNATVSAVVVDIAGDQCDAVPPSISMVTIEPPVVSNAQPNTIQVKAIVRDDGPCGMASVSGQAVPPGGVGGQRHPIIFRPSGDGQTYVGTLNLQQAAVRGQWTISWMQVLDRGNNLRAYSGSDATVSKATFRVE